MATIQRFEEVEAWKKARELTKVIYAITRTGEFSRDFSLRDQVRSASVSIMSSIAEGFERGGDKEFRQFLSQAKGSTGEVRSQLYVALDADFILQPTFGELYQKTIDIGGLLTGFMRYLGSSEFKGKKYM